MGVSETAGKVAISTLDALKSAPLAIALLLVNCVFLGFSAYILSEVSASARERDKVQNELIVRLVTDIRDCRTPSSK